MEHQKRLLEETAAAKATSEDSASVQEPAAKSENVWRLSQSVNQSVFASWGGDADAKGKGWDGGREAEKRQNDAAMGGFGASGVEHTTPPWFLMPDVIDVVLLRLTDGKDLAKCCGVNRLWLKHAGEQSEFRRPSRLHAHS
jgi:hypothetical protein